MVKGSTRLIKGGIRDTSISLLYIMNTTMVYVLVIDAQNFRIITKCR